MGSVERVVPDEAVVYAVSDVHLGLRERGPTGHSDAPEIVAGFFEWLTRVPPAGDPIPVERGGEVALYPLHPATDLILLGDILELWDGENASILASAASVAPSVRALACRKWYVLGNHDNILSGQVGRYPFGEPGLGLVGDVFPKADPRTGVVVPLSIGAGDYVFVHGHQFDRFFQDVGRTWIFLGHLRAFGAATGGYAWLFAAWTAAAVIIQLAFPLGIWGWLAIGGSVLLWFPRFYMTVARRIWSKLTGSRYDRAAALRGFARWWNRFASRVKASGPLSIIYGHTHLLDYVPSRAGPTRARTASIDEQQLRMQFEKSGTQLPSLYNISSWVSTRGPRGAVTWATFWYADSSGPLILGWDWQEGHPFHMPADMIADRWTAGPLTPEGVRRAQRLKWPPALVRRWSAGPGAAV